MSFVVQALFGLACAWPLLCMPRSAPMALRRLRWVAVAAVGLALSGLQPMATFLAQVDGAMLSTGCML